MCDEIFNLGYAVAREYNNEPLSLTGHADKGVDIIMCDLLIFS